MQLHDLKSKTKRTRSRQVGRGGKRGKTSGRGTKGQKARAGRKLRPEIRDTIKKIPKMRGRGKNLNTSIQKSVFVVNVSMLEKKFSAGDIVNPKVLIEKKIISYRGKSFPQVKILSSGDITKKITVESCAVSKVAQEKIEKAGGTIVK